MINTIIIEDETIIAERLKKMLLVIEPEISVSAIFESVSDSVSWLSKNSVDLIFQDIHLSDGNSFQIFDEVSVSCPIIFTSGYPNYALKAFKKMSVDYLLKPYSEIELRNAIQKYLAFFRQETGVTTNSRLESEQYQKVNIPCRNRFMTKVGKRIKTIKTNEIAFFYSQNKTTYIKTKCERKYPIDVSLSGLVNELSPQKFFKVNRNCIVSIDGIEELYLTQLGKWQVKTKPRNHFPIWVSADRLGLLKCWLDGNPMN